MTTIDSEAVADIDEGESEIIVPGADPDEVDGITADTAPTSVPARWLSRSNVVTFALFPLMVVALVAGAGYLKFRVGALTSAEQTRVQSVQAATETAIAMLSYSPDTAEATLHAAEDRLTGSFRDSYRSLIDQVVIPGAKQKAIATTATVPAAASITATERHATVMVFINQTIIVGSDAPTGTASAVEVTLDKVGDRWLVSGFDPK
ncbi:hypothetical protein [Mycolicibacterium sp. YH-1]|uniref:hypothetical protein n=1 Tax=Mycolicibacterium sp. YH-1 TaxID=2908837 RepID=UPI001F4C0C42|nr:hypothetical protein [Mycolicibacterium sp. YH-1]UNB54536.1 hypothetical protein L0M16_09550 [Mycolicibacterium sp. YH-1]